MTIKILSNYNDLAKATLTRVFIDDIYEGFYSHNAIGIADGFCRVAGLLKFHQALDAIEAFDENYILKTYYHDDFMSIDFVSIVKEHHAKLFPKQVSQGQKLANAITANIKKQPYRDEALQYQDELPFLIWLMNFGLWLEASNIYGRKNGN